MWLPKHAHLRLCPCRCCRAWPLQVGAGKESVWGWVQQHLPGMGQPERAPGTRSWTKLKGNTWGFCCVGKPPAAEGPRAGSAFLCLLCLPHHPQSSAGLMPVCFMCLSCVLFAGGESTAHSAAAHSSVGLSLLRFGELSPTAATQPLLSQPRGSFFILGHL